MPEISLIDYGLANMRSVANAIQYLGSSVEVVTTGRELKKGNRIILPGVGSFLSGMKGLKEREFIEPLNELVLSKDIPVLGICLGFQLMCSFSEEGNQEGLGWFDGSVLNFKKSKELNVPHIGWNEVNFNGQSRMFAGMDDIVNFYFVHSYHLPFTKNVENYVAGSCKYGVNFVAALEKENIMACQFHPEKSQLAGLKLIENFLST
ncbi:MAG: imidazole glycerol phosphate synthase subunit HisH 1 [Thermodesulfobacteriota bacterium]|nr:MAG: imidazole glycerol phosphate synthase subunit HisH 1 [Thermodesulfobacteriota bacterium]